MTDHVPDQGVEVPGEVLSFLDPALEAELDGWLSFDTEHEDLPETAGGADADRYLVALGRVRRELEERQAIAQARKQRINDWLEYTSAPLADQAERLEGLISLWAIAQAELTGNRTFSLPHGTVPVRRRTPRVIPDPRFDDAIVANHVETAIPKAVTRSETVKVQRSVVKAQTVTGSEVTDPQLLEAIADDLGQDPRQVGYAVHHPAIADPETGELTDITGLYLLVAADGRLGDYVPEVKTL